MEPFTSPSAEHRSASTATRCAPTFGSWKVKTSKNWTRIGAMNRSHVGRASQPAGSRGILASCFERQDAARTGRQDVCPTSLWEGKQRSCLDNLSAFIPAFGDQFIGSLALLHPADDRLDLSGRRRTRA